MKEGSKNIIIGPWEGSGLQMDGSALRERYQMLYERYQNIVDRITQEITRLNQIKVPIDEVENLTNVKEEFEQLLKTANMWWDRLKNKQFTTSDDIFTLESVATHMERQLNSWDLEKPEHKE